MIILPFSKVLKRLPSILSAQIGKKFNSCRSAEAIKNGLEKMKKERIKEKKRKRSELRDTRKENKTKKNKKKQRVEKDKENETEDKKKRDVSKSE